MSSIFSDPFFRRGSTLLGGELIEVDASGNPIAGSEIVGQIKAFQDVNPRSKGERYSNRLVYCVAARYKGSDVSDASTIAGQAYLFDSAKPLTEFTTGLTTSTHAAGAAIGVLDEYLSGVLRTNDIVWLVVKGPTSIKQTAAAISAGAAVQASSTAGSIVAQTGTNTVLGQQIAGSASAAAVGLTRVNLHSSQI
jgi:hypothetical protein